MEQDTQITQITRGGTTLPIIMASRAGIIDRRAEIQHHVRAHGSALVRGLTIDSPQAFQGIVGLFGEPFDSYRGGNTPRTRLTESVFTSTDVPAELAIAPHNELSYASRWPEHVYFACLTAAREGGATPICDGRAIWNDLKPDIRDPFMTLGVTYRQFLHGGYGLGKSWQETFETADPQAVENFLRDADAEFSWVNDGLRVTQRRAGAIAHTVTGEIAWFNQADQWHPSHLSADDAEMLYSLVDSEDDLPQFVTLGDGSPIPEASLQAIREATERNKVSVPWQVGDFMIVDNILSQHGREPYSGDRRVIVAMS
jgi:alpha-ketoglutarate-dependent taurine dioxygenase